MRLCSDEVDVVSAFTIRKGGIPLTRRHHQRQPTKRNAKKKKKKKKGKHKTDPTGGETHLAALLVYVSIHPASSMIPISLKRVSTRK